MTYRYAPHIHEHFIFEEGLRLKSYTDHKGNWTIGVGHLLGKSNSFSGMEWTREQVMETFEDDLDIAVENAYQIFPEFAIVPPNVQLAIVDMLFNMGINRFRGFKKTIRLLHAQKYEEAAAEALNSKWAKYDVPVRAKRVAKLLSNT